MNSNPSYQQRRFNLDPIELKTAHPSRGCSFSRDRVQLSSSLPLVWGAQIFQRSTERDLRTFPAGVEKLLGGQFSLPLTNVKIAKVATDRSPSSRTFSSSSNGSARSSSRKKVFNPVSGRLMSNVVSRRENWFFYFSLYA